MTAMLMVQDETVSTPGPREGGPRRHRAFTITEKLTVWKDGTAVYRPKAAAYGMHARCADPKREDSVRSPQR